MHKKREKTKTWKQTWAVRVHLYPRFGNARWWYLIVTCSRILPELMRIWTQHIRIIKNAKNFIHNQIVFFLLLHFCCIFVERFHMSRLHFFWHVWRLSAPFCSFWWNLFLISWKYERNVQLHHECKSHSRIYFIKSIIQTVLLRDFVHAAQHYLNYLRSGFFFCFSVFHHTRAQSPYGSKWLIHDLRYHILSSTGDRNQFFFWKALNK